MRYGSEGGGCMLLLCYRSLAVGELRCRKEYFQRKGVLICIWIAVICEGYDFVSRGVFPVCVRVVWAWRLGRYGMFSLYYIDENLYGGFIILLPRYIAHSIRLERTLFFLPINGLLSSSELSL